MVIAQIRANLLKMWAKRRSRHLDEAGEELRVTSAPTVFVSSLSSDWPLTLRQLLFRVILAYALCKSHISQSAANAAQLRSAGTEEYLSRLVIVRDAEQRSGRVSAVVLRKFLLRGVKETSALLLLRL